MMIVISVDNSIYRRMIDSSVNSAYVPCGFVYCQETGMLAFTFTLTSDELGDTFDGVDLNQFAMQQTIGRQESHFTIRPPKPGVYQLVIYVKVVQPVCILQCLYCKVLKQLVLVCLTGDSQRQAVAFLSQSSDISVWLVTKSVAC